MEPIYRQTFPVTDMEVDRYGRLRPSAILYYAQEIAGQHCELLRLDYDTLAQRRLFWAVTRQRVLIDRLPVWGEKLTVETWPMPTTRVTYPRSTVAYDAQGNEVFRAIGLWVLMDLDTRAMILPGKSGILVDGTLRGTEIASPRSLLPKPLRENLCRAVCFTDLDRNGHMNNTRYLDWIDDLLPSGFHREHPAREFTVCYLTEAREGQRLELGWELQDGPALRVEAHRENAEGGRERVFAADVVYG